MSVFPGPSNAIVYAQFNLQGRWKRMLIVSGGYGLLLMAAIWLTTELDDRYTPRDLQNWVVGLLGLQCANLLVLGVYRVESAVRGDVLSRMLESHRLMPIPPLGSILGYLFGAPLQAFLFAIVNFSIGLYCCSVSGLPGALWALSNATLLFYSIAIYAAVAQFAFFARGGFLLFLILGLVLVTVTANEALQAMPSLTVLFSPLSSRNARFFQMMNGAMFSSETLIAYAAGMTATAIIALVAIRVAIRRYRSSTDIGITAPLGLILLAVWVALAIVAMSDVEFFNYNRYQSYRHDDIVGETVFTFVSATLLSMFPIASAALAICRAQKSATPAKLFFDQTRVLVLAMLILGLLLVDVPREITSKSQPGPLILLIQFNFLVAISCIFRWGYALRRRAWILASFWVIITWLGPVIVDAVYHTATAPANPTGREESWSSIVAISPAGAVALIWSNSNVPLMPGIAGQILLTIIPLGLLAITSQWRHGSDVTPAQVSTQS